MDTGMVPAVVALRPGVDVVRRDAERLQLGLGPDAVVVPDTPVARSLLEALDAGAARLPADPEGRLLAQRLWRAGLLVEARAWQRARTTWPRLAPAAFAREPGAATEELARRAAARIALIAQPSWADELRALLAAAGLVTTDGAADVSLVAGPGEADRASVDALMGSGVPHLVMRSRGGEVSVGPFVVPGRTACLRCEDAHRTEADPRWPLLVAQLPSPLTPRVARDCPPEPSLLTLALAWAVRDLACFVAGGRPATWSSTITVDAELTLPRLDLLRHPHCGCAWGDLLASG